MEECEYPRYRQAREAQPHEQDEFAFRIKGSSRLSARLAVLREIWNLREIARRTGDHCAFHAAEQSGFD